MEKVTNTIQKIKNKLLTNEVLDTKVSKVFGEQKWISFSRQLINEGYRVYLYEAKDTYSKYLTIKNREGKTFKVRFSNHKPNFNKELYKDCDFYVGVTNFEVHTAQDAYKAVMEFMNS